MQRPAQAALSESRAFHTGDDRSSHFLGKTLDVVLLFDRPEIGADVRSSHGLDAHTIVVPKRQQ